MSQYVLQYHYINPPQNLENQVDCRFLSAKLISGSSLSSQRDKKKYWHGLGQMRRGLMEERAKNGEDF